MVSGSAFSYLIRGLTQISSIWLILYNLPVILRGYKIRKKSVGGVNYNQQNALIFSWFKV